MRLFNKKVWLPVFLATSVLSVALISGTCVANKYASDVNNALNIKTSRVVGGDTSNSNYYKSDYKSYEEMFQAKTKLMRKIGEEGTVLLKNENVLPLAKGKKVTILNETSFIFAPDSGGGAFHGQAVIDNKTTLSAALNYDGLTVSSEESDMASSDAVIVVVGRSQGEGNDVTVGNLALTSAETTLIGKAKDANSNVIVLVSGDYVVEIGNLKKDSGIKGIIKFGSAGMRGAYGLADVITGLASPSGKLVETFPASTISAPSVENFGNYEYTNKNKMMASQATKYVSYNEGIYTDYRYYETRYEDLVLNQGNASSSKGKQKSTSGWNYSQEVVYPFGYGLSYTSFSQKITSVEKKDDTVEFEVEVTNTGAVEGKDVVELYMQSPYSDYDKANYVEKSAVQLVGFAKTSSIEKGGSAKVTISVDKKMMASYDYTNAKTYILDDGDYYFSLGNGAHEALNNILAVKNKTTADGMDESGDASLVYTYNVEAFDAKTYSTSAYSGNKITNRFDDVNVNHWVADSEKVTYLSRSDWDKTYPTSLKITATDDMISLYNDSSRYDNAIWNDTKKRAAVEDVTYADYETENEVNSALTSGKITHRNAFTLRGKDYNDEGWKDILDNLSIYEMSRLVAEGRHYIQAAPSVSLPQSSGGDGPSGLTKDILYTSIDPTTGEKVAVKDGDTMTDGITDTKINVSQMDCGVYCSEPVLAATFNTELADQIGKMYGEDGLYTGTSFLWGLGLNIHRSPFGGRHTEYYSADHNLNGLIGSHVSKASKEKGVALIAKHFVVNDQEQNRIGVATFTNEQALRENYLSAFELVVTKGEAQGLMTAYNRIGMLSCTAEYDLLTGVLREEWNSNAYVISDLNSPTSGLYDGNAAIAAGLSTFLNNGTYDALSGAAVNTTLNVANIKKDATLLTATREACHRILFNYIHTNAANGISEDSRIEFITPWWKPTLTSISVILTIIACASFGLYVVSSIKEDTKNEK